MEKNSSTTDRELVITRLLNAPRDLVWEVWTNPEHIKHWWGPNGFTNTIFTMNAEAGGDWDFIMHGPDGTDFKNKSVYEEVVKPEKIVYRHETGPKFKATVTFTAEGKKTRLHWQMLFETVAEKENVVKIFKADVGLKQNIYKLEGYLHRVSSEKTMSLTRVFEAPIEQVFKAWTDPAQLVQWWGPKGFTNPVCQVNAEPGGSILIHMQAPDGTIFPMDGVYHEIVPSKKIIFTSSPLDKDGKPLFQILNTVTFTEENGKTRLTLEARISNLRPEAKHHVDGMQEGWSQSLERLSSLLQHSSS